LFTLLLTFVIALVIDPVLAPDILIEPEGMADGAAAVFIVSLAAVFGARGARLIVLDVLGVTGEMAV